MVDAGVCFLKNSELTVEVLPVEGGRISSLKSLHSGLEFLTQSRRRGQYPESGLHARFQDGPCAGIEECLPTVGPSGPETEGGAAPDHGDFWQLPWKLLADYNTFILGWLGGYAAFLGPVAGIMICDYFVVRKCVLQLDDLYLRGGIYEYSKGFNWRAVVALAVGAGTALVGLVVPSVRVLYDYSWFVGFAVSFIVYYAMMKPQPPLVLSPIRAAES